MERKRPCREGKQPIAHQPIALDEEVWLYAIDEIVGRDFFPDATRGTRPEGSVDVTGLSLDEFLHKYTSEDNASFREILDRTNAKRREKVAHLMLPPGARPALLAGQPTEGKKYEAINLLMYDGSSRSSLPLALPAERSGGLSSKSIQHRATSLPGTKELEENGGLPRDDRAPGNPEYSLLETPSFRPGEDLTPFITWGGIDATPLRLNDDGTIAGGDVGEEDQDGPKRSEFRMRNLPLREQLAHALGSKGSKKGGIFSTPRTTTPRSIRSPGSVSMTPAAQRLAAEAQATLKTSKPAGQSIFSKRPRSSWDNA